MKHRRRHILKLLLFLLALLVGGAIINVAVAWGCAMGRGNMQRLRFWTADDTNVQQRAKEFGYSVDFIHEQVAPSLRVESYLGGTDWHLTYGFEPFHIDSYRESGIPMRALCADLRWESSMAFDKFIWPWRPLVPGFAINTIFYAAVLWVLFVVPGAVRRRVRIKRGQCAACGYSLRGHDITSEKCPECGKAVTQT